MNQSITSYTQELGRLILGIQVNTSQGDIRDVDEGATRAVNMVESVKASSGTKAMLIGNGGSAAIASHIHNDLFHSIGLPAMVFYDSLWLTAAANDYGFEATFERALLLWTNPGDLLFAISSSGQSQNILRGVRACQELGGKVITFSGFKSDNPLRQMGDLNFYIASHSYGYVELGHSVLGHYITDSVLASVKSKLENQI